MKRDHVKFRRAKETNFLIMDEIIFDLFSPYALKVYGQLRKLMSYTQQCDEVEITVKNLADLSGISERKTYDVLNELEHTHFIIQRLNLYHFRRGQTNTFDVSQTYGFYKPAQELNTTAPNAEGVDNPVQKLPTPAPYAVPPAQYAEVTAPNADLYIQEVSQEVSKKKQNKEPVKPSVFSDTESVKTHITLVTAKRKTVLEDDTISQGIYYAYETNNDKSFDSVNKRINIFLKKVREGKWLIPQNWNGISSQSIREQEEYEQLEKRNQYEQEAKSAKNIFSAINQGTGFAGFKAEMQKLKDDVHGKDVNERGVPEKAVSSGR